MGWFSAPFVSSRLPDLPVLHTIMHGIASLKDGVFQTYAAELGERGGEYLGDSAKYLFVVVCVDLAGNREGLSIIIYLLARLHTSFSKHLCL